MTLRSCDIQLGFTKHAEGSALITLGDTRVLCTVSVTEGVPRFMRDQRRGAWLTAEYGMLPGATHKRSDREAVRGKQSGRTQEIQRMIGRSLRSCVDLASMPQMTFVVDCDVLQADGGTRMASVTGGCVALVSAIQSLQYKKLIKHDPIRYLVTGISVGMVGGKHHLDLSYEEDSQAETDMNVVMTDQGSLIEVQSTTERGTLAKEDFLALMTLAEEGNASLLQVQRKALGLPS